MGITSVGTGEGLLEGVQKRKEAQEIINSASEKSTAERSGELGQ